VNAAGVELTALSINDPGLEWFGADGPAVAKIANDFIAGIVRRHPQRFFGLCVLPLQDVRASLVELDRCVKQLGMKGILLYTNIALTRIIMSGMLDEFPKLKLVCPHLGGTLPSIIGRLDHQTQVLKRGPKNLKCAPSEYLRRVWLDVVSPQPLAMKFGYDFMGADRLLFSSDHPWVEPKLIRDTLESLNLPPADLEKIFTTNAQKLFRL
jgi:predicted TIM-barrel fold metal-dependent hydrolase